MAEKEQEAMFVGGTQDFDERTGEFRAPAPPQREVKGMYKHGEKDEPEDKPEKTEE